MIHTITLGLSPKAVESLLHKEGWVNLYAQELDKRLSAAKSSEFPERRFLNVIKPRLETIFGSDAIDSRIRESIRRWALIGDTKAYFIVRFLKDLPGALSEVDKIYREYSDVPIGPQHEDVVGQMTQKESERWRLGNVELLYTNVSLQNLLGIFVSELFFAFEAKCRAICSGSCLEFAIKAASSDITIQHKDVHKTLKMLAGGANSSVGCKMCPVREDCGVQSYLSIAQLYELFYHIRAIKDYCIEFCFNTELQSFLMKEYVRKGFEALCMIDEVASRLLKDYLVNPLPLSALAKMKLMNLT